jgi:hypothetical protein
MLEEKKYLQITSGRGPVECCRAVVLVMQQVLKDAESFNISVKIVERRRNFNLFISLLPQKQADSPQSR